MIFGSSCDPGVHRALNRIFCDINSMNFFEREV